VIAGETDSYQTPVLGYIRKQWLLGKNQNEEICKFGILDCFDVLYYWTGADQSSDPSLDILIEYTDGETCTIKDIVLND